MKRVRNPPIGPGIEAKIAGNAQGIIGAHNVIVENLTFYGSALPARPLQEIEDDAPLPCPYPGLAQFGPQDGALFFGRDAAIRRLETAVDRRTLTALVGASGTGKSSVVLAGLAPRLHARGGWRFSHFRVGTEPDKNPFLALARALVPLLGNFGAIQRLEETQKLADAMASGRISLTNVLGECRAANAGKRILLIADQFEEIFTLVSEEALRLRFIDTLLAGFPNRDQREKDRPGVSLVLTLRADFFGISLRHRPLADALQDRVETLGPMTRDELREAITRPAGIVNFEPGLVDTLLDDLTNKPGTLPLLQFALREMWGCLEKRRMTRASYDSIGRVEGALARHAQAIYEDLTAKGKNESVFRRLFTRLVMLGQDYEDTRRVVGRAELGDEAWALAQSLASEDNRLVVISAPVPGHETAEVAHEALIRNWPTLVNWLNGDREFQSWLRKLKVRVDDWRQQPNDEGMLLGRGQLAEAARWLASRSDELSNDEREYINASTQLRVSDVSRLFVKDLIETTEYQKLYSRLMSTIARVVDFDWANLTVFSPGGEYARLICQYGPTIESQSRWVPVGQEYKDWLERSSTTWTIELEEILRNGPDGEGLVKQPYLQAMLEAGVKSLIAMPLRQEERTVGCFTLISKRERTYVEETLQKLEQLGIHEALLAVFRGAESAERDFVGHLVRRIAKSNSYQELANTIVSDLAKFFNFENTSIFRVDRAREQFKLLAQVRGTAEITPIPEGYTQPLRDGLLGHTLITEKSLVLQNVDDGSKEGLRYVRVAPETASEMCIPIRLFGRIVWILNVAERHIYAFAPVEVERLEHFLMEVEATLENIFGKLMLAQTLDALPQAVVLVERNGNIVSCNADACRIFERSIIAADNVNIATFLPGFEGMDFWEGGVALGETIVVGERGKETSVLVSKSAFHEEYDYLCVVLQDVSQLQWKTDPIISVRRRPQSK